MSIDVRPYRALSTGRLALAALLSLYLVFIRTRGITETFCLLGDQILYWRMALGPWSDLPTGGGPTSVGGTTLGPIFCWAVWLIGKTIGPFTDYLPHAGGIGVALIQSAADAFLFLAIWRRFASPVLALGVVLLLATSPFDMSLSATIWNPPLAVALVKSSIASVLWGGSDGNRAADAAALVFAWLAVQAHSSGIFFAAALIAALVARHLLARRWKAAAMSALMIAAIVGVLQIPYLVERVRHPGNSASPGAVVQSVSYTLAHPGSVRLVEALQACAASVSVILLRPFDAAWPVLVFACGAVVAAYRLRRDPPLACVVVGPPLLAVAGFSLWQKDFDTYWFLVLTPGAALMLGLALTAWRRIARPAAVLLVVAVALVQPQRAAQAMTLHRLPEYGAIVRGSREINRRAAEVRRIDLGFPVPPSTEPAFLYQVLGGRLSPGARFEATIHRSGDVTFRAVPESSEGGRD